MFGGQKQGGGGNGMVNLTGLFNTKSGKGVVGYLKPEAFETLYKMMSEAWEKKVDLVFYVAPENNPKLPNMSARLSLAIGTPRHSKGGGFVGGGSTASSPFSNKLSAPSGPSFGSGKSPDNPPKDDIEDFLESYNK